MNFSKLYNRVVYNEAKEKQKREENVEQYDHSASAAEQEEEYDRYDDDDFVHSQRTWKGEDVTVQFPGRQGEYVVEGEVTYTVEEERPSASNGYIGSRWPEVEDIEVTGIYKPGDEHTDEVDITEDVTFEEMEIAEAALQHAFEHNASNSWYDR